MNGRHELKFYIGIADYMQLRAKLRVIAKPDANAANSDGSYTIRSLYFDNYADKAVTDKLSGLGRREKFRFRYYNGDTSFIRLEKKSKANRLTYKESVVVTRECCEAILIGDYGYLKALGVKMGDTEETPSPSSSAPSSLASYLLAPSSPVPSSLALSPPSLPPHSLPQSAPSSPVSSSPVPSPPSLPPHSPLPHSPLPHSPLPYSPPPHTLPPHSPPQPALSSPAPYSELMGRSEEACISATPQRDSSGSQLLMDLYTKIRTQNLRPRSIVDYTREAYIYRAGNVRITFDSHIRSSNNCAGFLHAQLVTIPVANPILLEIKYDGFIPDIIRNILQIDSGNQTEYSKYVVARLAI